jgi:predicted GIY-YIG superfamily endonuclease
MFWQTERAVNKQRATKLYLQPVDAQRSFSFAAYCRLELRYGGEKYRINPVCMLEWDEKYRFVCGYPDWTENFRDRSGPGVYAMLDEFEDRILYIGSTKNLDRRLTYWFRGKGARKISSWDLLPTHAMTISFENIATARQLERYLIGYLDPKDNNRLRLPEAEMRRQLERIRGTEDVLWSNGKIVSW